MHYKDNLNFIPAYIDNTNFRYIKVENKYIASLVIMDYPRVVGMFQITDSLPMNMECDISMYIQKQDTNEVLKKLTYAIASSGSEIKDASENQVDIDVISKMKEDSKNLRREIQLNNEEVYYFHMYITIYNEDKEALLNDIKIIQSRLYAKGIIANVANFRHLDSYLLTLPLINQENELLKKTYRNMITSSISNIFPFYTKTVFDKYGVIIGYTSDENKILNIDIFDNRYINGNMCIFGSSGSGKSYFTKMLIIRNFLSGKRQVVIDPEGEYIHIANHLNCDYLTFTNESMKYFNILQIDDIEISIYHEDIIYQKTKEVASFVFNLLDLDISDNKLLYEELENSIIKTYKEFKITTLESLYKSTKSSQKVYINKTLIENTDFPVITDVLKNTKTEKLTNIVKEFMNHYTCFSNITNVDFYGNLFVLDTSKLNIKNAVYVIDYFLAKIDNYLSYQENSKRKKLVIYMDEVWKYIQVSTKIDFATKIFKLYKTIRKKKASIITITQDMSDFFKHDSGNYGKSILNNAAFKVFFKSDYSDMELLNNQSVIGNMQIETMKTLDKGQALFIFGNNFTKINIKLNDYEKEIIEGGINETINST